jgi:hypothetical protein
MTNDGKPREIHLYDSVTGEYVTTYESQRALERENGMYRGAISDMLTGKTKLKLLISTERYDIHPSFEAVACQKPPQEIPQETKPVKVQDIGLMSEAELRKKHDMFYMIFSFVKGIPEGKFVEETNMLRQLTLLGKPRYRDALSRAELKQFKGKVDGVTYYGASVSIQKLKSEGVLQ